MGVLPRNFSSRCINCGWLSEFSSNADPSVTDLGLGSVLADVSVSSWSDIWSSTNWHSNEKNTNHILLSYDADVLLGYCTLGTGWGPYKDLGTSLAKMPTKIITQSSKDNFLQKACSQIYILSSGIDSNNFLSSSSSSIIFCFILSFSASSSWTSPWSSSPAFSS